MGDKCVVCGEADEGKPLYKKLGSGEYNVEVIVALRDLELTSLPESAKADHYICWDCDETILQEYGRYLEYEEKRRTQEEKIKEEKRMKRKEAKKRLHTEKPLKRKQHVHPPMDEMFTEKLKAIEAQKTSVSSKNNHCVICDCTFEIANRGYYRHTLKKMVNDDMDVASVMEFLGLARRIAPEVKAKRYVCNNCFYTIRRNYKNKVAKGTSVDSLSDEKVSKSKKPIHRATPDEHAAEIAKLLPPALAECYKIMTSDNVFNVSANADVGSNSNGPKRREVSQPDAEAEEEEGLQISQDEHGNYVVDMKIDSPSKNNNETTVNNSEQREKAPDPQSVRKKKNVLLPKRNHHHLENDSVKSSQAESALLMNDSVKNDAEQKEDENVDPGEVTNSRTCNICGITFANKPEDWWHTLSSSLTGLESVTVSMALQMLETSLANTSKEVRLAGQVCNLCFGMVSSGFRLQVVERIARQKNISASQVNFSKIKVRMMRKEDLRGVKVANTSKKSLGKDNHKSNSNNDSCSKSLIKGKPKALGITDMEKSRVNNTVPWPSPKKNHGKSSSEMDNKLEKSLNSSLETVNKSEQSMNSSMETDNQSEKSMNSSMDTDSKSEKSTNSSISDLADYFVDDLNDSDYVMSDDSDFDPDASKNNRRKKKNVSNLKAPDSNYGKRTKRNFNHSQDKKKEKSLSNPQGASGILSPECSVKEVLVVNSGMKPFDSEVVDGGQSENAPQHYEVNSNCHFYFPLSKMCETKVILSDIAKSLPKEAFDGRSLLLRSKPGGGYQVSFAPLELPVSEFQFLLNTMLPSNWSKCVKKLEVKKERNKEDVSGRCVVCAFYFQRPISIWRNLLEDIKPPSLQVPVRWVLASLSIAPVKLTSKEKEDGKVCEVCFTNLTKQFEEFVRVKIGESCDMRPSEVVITDYVVTFNQETMNIEADPVDLCPEEELEESSKIIGKVESMLKSVNLDSLFSESYINPLEKNDFNTCLLLVLNELKTQIGADFADLANWLMKLMPVEYHLKGLELMESKVSIFIDKISATLDGSSRNCFENLGNTLPMWLFTCTKNPKVAKKNVETPVIKTEIKEEPNMQNHQELNWEDFLKPVNVDQLLEGKGRSLSRKDFNNGLLYSLWRLAAELNVGDEILGKWLQQVAPIPLAEEHVKMLLGAPKPIHDHLLKHPEDLKKLDCVIIPEVPVSSSAKTKSIPKDSSKTGNSPLENNPSSESKRMIANKSNVVKSKMTTSKRKADSYANDTQGNKRIKSDTSSPRSSSSPAPVLPPSDLRSSSKEGMKSRTVTPVNSNIQTRKITNTNNKKVTSPKTESSLVSSSKPQQKSVIGIDLANSKKLTLTKPKPKSIPQVNQTTLKESQKNISSKGHLSKECQEQEVTVCDMEKDSAATALASKIKELEEQLQAVKRQNQELLKMNLELESGNSTNNPKEVQKEDSKVRSADQCNVQMDLAICKPNQVSTSLDTIPKKEALSLQRKKQRLSIEQESRKSSNEYSSEEDQVDKENLVKISKVKNHNEIKPKLSEQSLKSVPTSSGVSDIKKDNGKCMTSVDTDNGNLLEATPVKESGDRAVDTKRDQCLEDNKSVERISSDFCRKGELKDLKGSDKCEVMKDKGKKAGVHDEKLMKRKLSLKKRRESVEIPNVSEGSTAITSIKCGQMPSGNLIDSHSKDACDSKLMPKEESRNMSSKVIDNENYIDSDSDENTSIKSGLRDDKTPCPDLVQEHGTSNSISEDTKENESNHSKSQQSSMEKWSSKSDSPKPSCNNNQSNIKAESSDLCDYNNSDGKVKSSESLVSHSGFCSQNKVQKDFDLGESETTKCISLSKGHNAPSACSRLLGDRGEIKEKDVVEKQKEMFEKEGTSSKKENAANIENLHKTKTGELGKKPVNVVEAVKVIQSPIEKAVSYSEKYSMVVSKKSDAIKKEDTKETSQAVHSSCVDDKNNSKSGDSIINKSGLSESCAINASKDDKEWKGNSSFTEKNKTDNEFSTKLGVNNVSASKCELKEKDTEISKKKIKIKRDSMVKYPDKDDRSNSFLNDEGKGSESADDSIKGNVNVLLSSDKGNTPEKVATSKKPKPRFEDLMTYDS